MSDQATVTGAPAVPPTAGDPSAAMPQQLIINAQYVKDLSFENPHAPNSLRQQQAQPAVDINVDVKAQSLGAENYEVVLTIKAGAKVLEEQLFIVELTYAALITVRNMPQEMLSPVILVETPRQIFPFARNIIADTTRNGGFPPLMINPIDFGELLRRNAAAAPPAAATGGAPPAATAV